ncbi:hypothetical protein PIROE2DRAFT_14233, partial [Piromyces sp. E2]
IFTLSPSNFDKPFIIRSGIGGVLLQVNDFGVEKPLSYVGRTLSDRENNYPITEHEVLITDHIPVVGIFQNKEPTTRRHIHWITEFNALKIIVEFEDVKSLFKTDYK